MSKTKTEFGPPFGLVRTRSVTTGILPEMNVPASGMDEPETLIWQGAFSGRSMIGSLLAVGIASVLVPVMIVLVEAMRLNTTVWLVGAGLLLVVWAAWILTMLYQKLSRHYVITTQRIKHREGILLRKVDRIELIDVDDVTYRQGVVQSLLGVGDIQIISSDTTHPKLTLRGIANVSRIADQIDDARRAERLKRGLHVEMI